MAAQLRPGSTAPLSLLLTSYLGLAPGRGPPRARLGFSKEPKFPEDALQSSERASQIQQPESKGSKGPVD